MTNREKFEEIYEQTYQPIIRRPYPKLPEGGYQFAEIQQGWEMAQRLAAEAVLENDCMIGHTWFMKGTPVAALIEHAEGIYKAEAVAQNSKIEFLTDDNEVWFAHDVPFFGRVQLDRIEEHGLVEWDIYFGECWQGPFDTKSKAIQHLEACIQEKREEASHE